MSDALLDKAFPIGGQTYSIGRMAVFDQMHVASEFRDIISGLALMRAERPKELSDADFDGAVQFILTSNTVSSAARDHVTNLCLRRVRRRAEGGGWVPILAADNVMQFADIGPTEICKLLYAAFDHNKLLDFFSTGPSASEGPKVVTGSGQS